MESTSSSPQVIPNVQKGPPRNNLRPRSAAPGKSGAPSSGNNATPGAAFTISPSICLYNAAARAQGTRPSQQDEYLILPCGQNMLALAIFDGHGTCGGQVSAFARASLARLLPNSLENCTSNENEVMSCLTSTFARIVSELSSNSSIDCYLSGTTAIVVLITPCRIFTANIGDSRAILACTESKDNVLPYILLSSDHNCDNQEELERVLKAGGRVERANSPISHQEPQNCDMDLSKPESDTGPLRIYKGTLPYPGLVVTRSLGDDVAHRIGVLSEPEIRVHELNGKELFLVVGSDGLWDGLDFFEIQEILAKNSCPTETNSLSHSEKISCVERSTREMVTSALRGQARRQIEDNISVVCVYFSWTEKVEGPKMEVPIE